MPAIGTNSDDILTGDAIGETINGLDGTDLIDGAGGADTLNGGDNGDAIVGGAGGDTLNGGDGGDILITGGLGGQTLQDLLTIEPSIDYVYFNFSPLFGGSNDDGAADTVLGGDGDDEVYVSAGDSANGGDGEDVIAGLFVTRGSALSLDLRGDGNAAMAAALGGAVSNFEYFNVFGTAFGDTVWAHALGSTIYGFGGSDTLAGGAGDDVIDGGTTGVNQTTGQSTDDGVADIINAGAGSDLVYVGLGDSANGGDGSDTLYMNFGAATSGLNITVGLNAENAAYSTAIGGTIAGFESFGVYGSNHADTINLQGFYTRSVSAGAGADIINLVTGSNYITVMGDDGNDQITVTGGTSAAYLYGGDGIDTITGGAGADYIDHGSSFYSLGSAGFDDGDADIIQGMGGGDSIGIGLGDSADGGDGNDTLTVYFMAAGSGRTVDLRTTPSASLSTAVGGTIANFETYVLYGSNHADTFFANDEGVQFIGGDGADTLTGGADTDIIYHNLNPTWVIATQSDYFGDFRDYVDDGDADTISAGGGSDMVYAGLGDNADGGAGSDTLHIAFTAAANGVNINLSTDANAALSTASGGTIAAFETFYVTGSQHADTIVGGTSTTAIYGLDGNDNLTIGATGFLSGYYATVGGRGADTIVGSSSANVIVTGESGFVTFSLDEEEGYEGHRDRDIDSVSAGDGTDIILAGVLDNIDGGAGSDTLHLFLGGATSGVTINMTGGANAGVSAGSGGTVQNVESFYIYGSEFGDTITGDASLQQVYGHAGHDTISIVSGSAAGGDGNDTLSGNSALGVQLEGDDGNDTVTGGIGGDLLSGGDGDDTLNSGEGDDFLAGGDGDDALDAGGGDDSIDAGYGTDSVDGGEGDDQVNFTGVLASYTIAEANGVITVTGAQGVTTLTNVEALYFSDGQYIPVAPIEGTPGDDNPLDGAEGNDTIDGLAGNDVINGLGGDDVLIGGTGDDALNGGAGNDTADYSDETGSVFVHLGWNYAAGSAFLGAGAANIGQDTLSSIEYLIGGAGADILIGGTSDVRIHGGAGSDWLEGGTGNDTINGEEDADAVFGGAGNDALYGGSGNDGLIGGAGDDTIYGDTGVDWIIGEGGDDVAYGGADTDVMLGGDGDDAFSGGTGNDALIGDAGADTLNGNEGDDWIEGGAGGDTMTGGDGADTLIGQDGDDVAHGGIGNDGLSGGAGNDTLNGEDGDDYITGEDGVDTLNGGAGNDGLFGGAGANVYNGGDGDDGLIGGGDGETMNGGTGADWLQGWGGADQLTGGTGGDSFVYTTNQDSLTTAMDRILDFNRAEGDVIRLVDVDANWLVDGDQAFTIVGAFSNQAGQMTAVYTAGTNLTLLSFDMNGDSVADMAIEVVGNITSADNFIL